MPINTCAKCQNRIIVKEFLRCSSCKLKFDLSCANMSNKQFVQLDASKKIIWKCSACKKEQSKTSTPISHDASLSSICGDPNVTIRRPTSRAANDSVDRSSTEHTAKSCDCECNSQNLEKEDIRNIFKEELEGMRSSLIAELTISIKQMVTAEVQAIFEKVNSMENSVIFLSEMYEAVKEDCNTYRQNINQLQKENGELSNTVRDLTTRLQSMEQHNRSNNIEIQCVPEHRSENLPSIIKQLSHTISYDLHENDVHHCTRVAKNNKSDNNRPRSIVVKLATPHIRDTFLAHVIKFNKANPKDKLNSGHIGIGGNKQPIYVMEHLSYANKALHAAARIKSKEMKYQYVWVKHGKIFMRKTDDSELVYVKDLNVLDRIH